MKAAIAQKFAAVSRSLGSYQRQKLRGAVPLFQARTRGVRHPEFEIQQARALASSLFPAAPPAAWDSMAFYLVAVTGISELDAGQTMSTAKLDSMSEMGEMESMRLQMAMDRMSKMMTTLSNMLKRASETSSAITQNLK